MTDSGPTRHLRSITGGRIVSDPQQTRRGCRYRVRTKLVPIGSVVRHPPCPLCGQRLGYVARDGEATYLHIEDPHFRVAILD